jgi:branched-chain amino acid transport system permease protein
MSRDTAGRDVAEPSEGQAPGQPTTDDDTIPSGTDETDESPANRGIIGFLDPRSFSVSQQLGVLGLLGLAVLPIFLTSLQALTLTSAFFFAMFAMSWDAVSGYTGQISFGHGLFFAVGGYTSALLNLGHGVPPSLSIPAGVVLAAVAGVVIGVPALRLRGPYLSLITLVAPLILLQIFISYSGIFGGELGISAPASLLGFAPYANYYLAFGLFLFILAILLAVTRSNAGAVLTAIREDEDTVAAAGLNAAKFKTFAFVLSAAIGGLAGAVFVHTPQGSPRPSQLFSVLVNVEVIIAAILGGMGTIVGAAIGGLFFFLFRDWLSGLEYSIPLLNAPISEFDFLIFSVITLVLLFVLPGGFLRAAMHWGRGLLDRSAGGEDRAATDGGQTPVESTLERYRKAIREITSGDRE